MLLESYYLFDFWGVVLSIESFCLQTDVSEVNEVFGRVDGLPLLPSDNEHPK